MTLLKRISAIFVAGSMMTCMLSGNIAGATEASGVKYFNDFSEDLTYFSSANGYKNLEDSGDNFFGQAMKINPVEKQLYINVNTPMTDSKDFSLSFDFKAGQEDHPMQMFCQEVTGASLNEFNKVAALNYDVKGNLVINSQAGSFSEASGSYSNNLKAVYVGTDWTNITMHFHPAGYNTTVDWYINGEYILTSTASNIASGRKFTGGFETFHFGTTHTGAYVSDQTVEYDGTEYFLIDNFKIEYLGGEYISADIEGEIGTQTTVLPLFFSENLKTEIKASDIKIINAENGESVSVAGVNGSAKKFGKIEIEVNGEFSAETEYIVKLPEGLESMSGKKLRSNLVYFVPTGAMAIEYPEITDSILSTDGTCDELTVGALTGSTDMDDWKKYLCTDWKEDISAENTGTEEKPNIAIKFAPDSTSAQHFRMEAGSPFKHDATETTVVWSVDIMRPELKRSYPLMLMADQSENMGNPRSVGYFFFDSYGNFVYLNATGDWWSTEDCEDISKYSSKQTAYAAGIEANEWVNVTAVVDLKGETVSYFVDKEYVGKANWPSNRKGMGMKYFGGMRISPEHNDALPHRDGRAMYFDNYKLGYSKISSNKVTTFRVYDREGNVYGPMNEKVSADIRKLEITASCNIGDISTATVTLTDKNGNGIAISNPAVSNNKLSFDVDECLKKNMQYIVAVSGMKSENGDIKAYENSFSTTDKGEFIITSFGVVDQFGNSIGDVSEIPAGEKIYLNVAAVNTTDDDVKLNASVSYYNKAVLTNDIPLEITFDDNNRGGKQSIEFTVSDTADLYLIATLTDAEKRPVEKAIEIGTMNVSEGEWTISFEDKTEADKEVYAEASNPSGEIVYRGQVASDENGDFGIDVQLPEDKNTKSGIYTLVWVDENGKTSSVKTSFASSLAAAGIIEQIKTPSEGETESEAIGRIESILEDESNRYALGIFTENTDELDFSVAAEIIYNEYKDAAASDSEMTADIRKAVCIAEVISGQADNLFDDADVLEIQDLKIADYLEKSFVTESFEKAVTQRLYGADVEGFDDFDESLTEKFVLETVKNPDGEDNLIEVMKEFSDEIGITSNGKTKAYRAVMYNDYEDYAELKLAFEKANKESTSSGGGSSSGGGGRTSIPIVEEITEDDGIANQQIPYPVFSDIADVEWASDAITRLAEMQIVNGKGDYKFCPHDNVTRAELAKMVVLALEYETDVNQTSPFKDIPDWSRLYVDAAYSNGIVNGYDESTFGGNDFVTRQDMVTVIYRAAIDKGVEFVAESSNIFSDSPSIAEYAKEGVHTLYNAGVINGVETGVFSPEATATRAEVAKIIYNIIKL